VAGKKDQLVGRIQERYGISKDEAQKQADEWAKAQSDMAQHEQQRQYEQNKQHDQHKETVKR